MNNESPWKEPERDRRKRVKTAMLEKTLAAFRWFSLQFMFMSRSKIATDAPLRSSFHMSVWDAYVASIVKAGIKKLPRYYHYNVDIDI